MDSTMYFTLSLMISFGMLVAFIMSNKNDKK